MIDANPPPLAVAAVPAGGASRRSDRMLAELLALNEEMIVQLRLERLSSVGSTDFIAAMMEQHEQVASRLRTQLSQHASSAHRARTPSRGISLCNPLTG
jgi:molybdopterin-guanine dinucleotide biosynthesis protein A